MSADAQKLDLTMMIDANPRYCPITASTVLVDNLAETILYRKEPVRSKATDSLSFTLDLSDHFVGRDIMITWDKIPLTVTRHAATTLASDPNSFHANFFNSYQALTLKQFGLLNAINTITVIVDGKTISTSNASDIMEQLGYYYSPDELARFLDASNHNLYYSNLVPNADPWIPSYTTTGEKCLVKGSSLSENDPFSATVSDQFNSRIPLFTTAENAAIGATSLNVTLHGVSTFLPFNILGISGDISPLYHAKTMQVNIQLHTNWPSRIFQTKRVAGTVSSSPFTFAIDRTAWGTNNVADISCNFKLYRAPQYIRSKMDAANDKYIQALSIVEQDTRVQDVVFKADSSTAAINSTLIELRAIPKRIVISLVNKRITDEEFLTDAAHFARFDSLGIELGGSKTDVASSNSSEQLYYLSKANGLELNKQQALYTLGFPIVLETSDNLGSATNSYVGLATKSSGSHNMRITGTATRLHHDTEEANFKASASEADLRKRAAKSYEMRVVVIYAGYFTYNLMGTKFGTIENLTMDELNSLSQHVNVLYESFAPKMNVLGGSWLSSIAPALKNVAKGVFNVVKAAVGNKDGLRDALMKAYKGEGAPAAAAAVGGAFDNHIPLMGGGMQSNIIAGRDINGWASH